MSTTVLIVDADPETRTLSRKTLTDAGYEVLEAATGFEAMDAISLQAPDAVLLGVELPDVSGWDLLDRLRSDSGIDPLRVVVFSAEELSEEGSELGESVFLVKPFEPADLLDAVRNALGEQPSQEGLTGKLADVVAAFLEPGEHVERRSDALMRIAPQFYAKCRLVLTDRRLLVLRQAWPWGYKVSDCYDRNASSVARNKERIDGSRLVWIRHDGQEPCFYFGRRWREEASALSEALGAAQD